MFQGNFFLHKTRLIRASRLALTLMVGFFITKLTKMPDSLWVPITIIVVLFDQSTVGGALQRGFLRIAATLSAALVGCAVIIVFGNREWMNTSVVILAPLAYAYLFMDTKQNYIGALGSATLAIVLTNTSGLDISLTRSMTIIVGVTLAIISTLVFFPKYAKSSIKVLLRDSIEKLESIVTLFVQPHASKDTLQERYLLLEEEFSKDIATFHRLIDESSFEIFRNKQKRMTHYKALLTHLRRLYRLFGAFFYDIPGDEVRLHPHYREKLLDFCHTFRKIQDTLLEKNFVWTEYEKSQKFSGRLEEMHHPEQIFFDCLLEKIDVELKALIKVLSLGVIL